MPALSSHEGGGGWPGGVFGPPPGPLGRRCLFGDGAYSQNIIQGGGALQPQTYIQQVQVNRTLGTNIGDMVGPGTLAAAFDGVTAQGIASGACTTTNYVPKYVGKDWGAGNEKRITGFRVYGSTDQGFADTGSAISLTHTLQCSNDGVSWTDLGAVTATNAINAVVSKFDIVNTTKYRYARVRHSGGATNCGYTEVQFFETVLEIENAIVVTGAATVAPDVDTGASAFSCANLVVDGGSATLAPSTNSKGLVGIVSGGVYLANGGRIHIDKLGKAGNFGNLTVLDLVPQGIKRRLKSALAAFVVLGEGAAGGASVSGGSSNHGLPGSAATAMKTGGGGAGGAQTIGGCSTGPGGKGGPCCGGAGGGGMHEGSTAGRVGEAAGPYGGPGGNSKNNGAIPDYSVASGGAGDTVGLGVQNGQGAGGGLLMLFSPVVSIGAGCVVSADGANGGGGAWASGGSAGGGCVCVVTPAGGYTNNGTVRASGGSAVSGSWSNGGAGGAGSVNILTVS